VSNDKPVSTKGVCIQACRVCLRAHTHVDAQAGSLPNSALQRPEAVAVAAVACSMSMP